MRSLASHRPRCAFTSTVIVSFFVNLPASAFCYKFIFKSNKCESACVQNCSAFEELSNLELYGKPFWKNKFTKFVHYVKNTLLFIYQLLHGSLLSKRIFLKYQTLFHQLLARTLSQCVELTF